MIWANEMALVEKEAVKDAITMAKHLLCSIDNDDDLNKGFGMREALVTLHLWPESEEDE